jgi:hypothetical protein
MSVLESCAVCRQSWHDGDKLDDLHVAGDCQVRKSIWCRLGFHRWGRGFYCGWRPTDNYPATFDLVRCQRENCYAIKSTWRTWLRRT